MPNAATFDVSIIEVDATTTLTEGVLMATESSAGAVYQWLRCNDNGSTAVISGETAQTFTPEENGNYAVSVTLGACTVVSDCVEVGVLSTENAILTGFSVFPNPAQSSVTILLANSDSIDQAVIYNTLGQEVIRSTSTTIDISSLSKGMYLVEVTTPLGRGIEKLLVD